MANERGLFLWVFWRRLGRIEPRLGVLEVNEGGRRGRPVFWQEYAFTVSRPPAFFRNL